MMNELKFIKIKDISIENSRVEETTEFQTKNRHLKIVKCLC